jgi:Na+/H+ antiporter
VEQNEVWILIGLFGVSIPLIALARRANIPYPVVLVIGGLFLGFVPGLPDIQLDPNLVLIIFLPPLLYWEAVTAPTDVMRANASQIGALAIGLVIATAIVVAVVAHATIVNLSWALAFVLGAIVAPTDELASAPVLERMRMPRHVIAIVVGESLLNDASALIIYGFAITAAVRGVFNFGNALVSFVIAAVGGIAIGIIVTRLAVEGWRRIKDTQLQATIAFLLPYISYLMPQRFGLSGVLSVVFAGVFANRATPRVLTPATRLQGTNTYDMIVFLINAFLFLMVGLQLRTSAHNVFLEYPVRTVIWYAVAVNLAVIGTRFAWTLGLEYVPLVGASSEHNTPDWRHAMIVAWSGLRGAVSLAAALAIPTTIVSGAPLGHRHLIIFLTFSVILVTLVLGGLTLPAIVRLLELPSDTVEADREIRRGVLGMSEAALQELQTIEAEGNLDEVDLRRLRRRYEHRRKHVDGHPEDELARLEAEERLIAAERRALLEMRDRGEIDNTILRELQRVLDITEETTRHRSAVDSKRATTARE